MKSHEITPERPQAQPNTFGWLSSGGTGVHPALPALWMGAGPLSGHPAPVPHTPGGPTRRGVRRCPRTRRRMAAGPRGARPSVPSLAPLATKRHCGPADVSSRPRGGVTVTHGAPAPRGGGGCGAGAASGHLGSRKSIRPPPLCTSCPPSRAGCLGGCGGCGRPHAALRGCHRGAGPGVPSGCAGTKQRRALSSQGGRAAAGKGLEGGTGSPSSAAPQQRGGWGSVFAWVFSGRVRPVVCEATMLAEGLNRVWASTRCSASSSLFLLGVGVGGHLVQGTAQRGSLCLL